MRNRHCLVASVACSAVVALACGQAEKNTKPSSSESMSAGGNANATTDSVAGSGGVTTGVSVVTASATNAGAADGMGGATTTDDTSTNGTVGTSTSGLVDCTGAPNDAGMPSSHPNLTLDVTPGIEVLSVNLVAYFRLQDALVPVLDLAIEIENTSSDVLCETETTVTLDGLEIGGELFAAAHFAGEGLVSVPCLEPGAIGVIAWSVTSLVLTDAELQSAQTLGVHLTAMPGVEYPLPPVRPSVTIEVVNDGGNAGEAYQVTGSVESPTDLADYALTLFPRDSRGLLTQPVNAFPLDGGSPEAGVPWSFIASWSEPAGVARCGAIEEVLWFDKYRLDE